MSKKLRWCLISTPCLASIFCIMASSCNKHMQATEKINWLETWDPVKIKSDPSDRQKVDSEVKSVRVYVRGWLADYADSVGKRWKVKQFSFDTASRSPLAFKYSAYLKPHVRKNPNHHGPGGHLIPPEPPPPQ